jgi:hypothetical protein
VSNLVRVEYQFNPDEPQYNQALDWSCSACSLAWLNRAMGIQVAQDELSAIDYIGTTHNINSIYGLMDGSGGRLVECLREQGGAAVNGWWSFDQVLQLAPHMGLLAGGVGWYHWIGIRGEAGGRLAIANSAPGWMGIYDELTADDWIELGPFAVVAAPTHVAFPPV